MSLEMILFESLISESEVPVPKIKSNQEKKVCFLLQIQFTSQSTAE